jgi:hypothetical protein
MVAFFFPVLQFPVPLGAFSVVTTTNGNSATKTIPAEAAVGDLALLFDTAFSQGGSVPATAVPADFTSLKNDTILGSNGGVRAIVSAKKLVGGDPGSGVTGLSGGTQSRYIFTILRPDAAFVGFTSNDADGQGTSGNPSPQTISAGSAATKPVVVWAHWYGTNFVDPRTASPAMTEVEGSSLAHFAKYKVYNSADSPQDHTVDMDDEGSENILQSGYLTFS